jgi:transposase
LEAGKDSADGEAVFVEYSDHRYKTSQAMAPSKKRSGQSVERWHENHADAVGAINILSRGMQQLRDEGQDTTDASVGIQVGAPLESARMACGSNGAGRRKQEPAETTAQGTIHA